MSGGFGFSDYNTGSPQPAAVGAALLGGGGGVMPAVPVEEMGRTAIPGFGADSGTKRPETTTPDGAYDPGIEHSPSSTAAAVGFMLQRTSGGGTGAGRVQNPSFETPFQQQQWQKLGLSEAEIAMLQRVGAIKSPSPVSTVGSIFGSANPDTMAVGPEGPPMDPDADRLSREEMHEDILDRGAPAAAQDATAVRGFRRSR